MTIGEQLSNARKARTLTQQQVADHLHVARQTISNWEVGRSYPDIASLMMLSDLFQLSLDELVKEDTKMMNDLQLKEQERRSARGMFWGSWLVNLVVLIFIVSSDLHLPGTHHGWATSLVLAAVMAINLGVLASATKRYRQFKPNRPVNLRRELPVNLGGTIVFAVVTYSIWGFNWALAGIVTGMLVGSVYRFIYGLRTAHRNDA